MKRRVIGVALVVFSLAALLTAEAVFIDWRLALITLGLYVFIVVLGIGLAMALRS